MVVAHDRRVQMRIDLVTVVVEEYDVNPPRTEAYGSVAVFLDVAGNRWDLLGPG